MNRFLVLLAVGAVTASTSLLGVNSARAQSSTSDTAYCRTLIAAYQHYGHARQAVPLGVATAVAIEQCREGNAQDSVPVLEQKLHEAGIALPEKS
jgi:hypothetical protein